MLGKVVIRKDKLNDFYNSIPIRDINNNDIKYTINNKINCISEYCDNFEDVLTSNFPKKSLKNFYYNINNLKVKKKSFKLRKLKHKNKGVEAYYNSLENKIVLNKKSDIEKFIYHELFHLASSSKIIDDNTIILRCGFINTIIKTGTDNLSKGRALTEGYTELLAQRYFDDDDIDRKINIYPFENRVAFSLENIVSEEKMSNYYLNSDIASLMEELRNYSDTDKIVKFLNETDALLYCEVNGNMNDLNAAVESYYYIGDYLVSTLKNKIDNDLYNSKYQKETANRYIRKFIKIVPNIFLMSRIDKFVYDKGYEDKLYKKYKYKI